MTTSRCVIAASLLSVLAAAGCRSTEGGGLGPKPPVFAPDGQAKCGVGKSQSEPLIVEWPSAERTELEALAHKGVVVVAYHGCEMRVLPRCRAPGAYAYTAITRKRDVVTITDADELYANVPVGAAALEGKLASSGQLNVSMTIVGRYETSRAFVGDHELDGDCAGATHVVSGITAGSFRFFAGAAAELGAAVDALGAGAGAKSKSSSELLAQDGDEAACAKSATTDAAPPDGCGGLLRIEVVPIGRAKSVAPSCPAGTAWDGKQCVAAAGAPKALEACRLDDAKECTKQCAAGEIASCNSLAFLYVSGTGGVAKDAEKARALFERSCEAGSAWGCYNLGLFFYAGDANEKKRAVALFDRACEGHVADGCGMLAQAHYRGEGGLTVDKPRSTKLFRRACELGSLEACVNVGLAYEHGTGVDVDKAKAALMYRRACDAQVASACTFLGDLFEKGEGGLTLDKQTALSLYQRACSAGDEPGCAAAKRLKSAGS